MEEIESCPRSEERSEREHTLVCGEPTDVMVRRLVGEQRHVAADLLERRRESSDIAWVPAARKRILVDEADLHGRRLLSAETGLDSSAHPGRRLVIMGGAPAVDGIGLGTLQRMPSRALSSPPRG